MSRPLRILFFGDASSNHTARWCRWFASAGHSVWLATDTQPEAAIEGVELLPLPGRRLPTALRFPMRLRAARRWASDLAPDLAHGHYLQQYGYLAARCGVPYALSAWGSDVLRLSERGPSHERWTREALGRAVLVTADSADVAEGCVRLGAAPSAMLRVVFGPDIAVIQAATGNAVRAGLGIGEKEVLVLWTRNLEPLYRPVLAAQGIADAISRSESMRGLIVGEGSLADEVRAIASTMSGRLSVLSRQPAARVPELFAAADIFVSIPETDGTSVSLLEAMAAGAIPVVSDLPANREWVDDRTGVVLPSVEGQALVEALAETLSALASDGSRREALSRAAGCSPEVLAVDFGKEMRRVEAAYRAMVRTGD